MISSELKFILWTRMISGRSLKCENWIIKMFSQLLTHLTVIVCNNKCVVTKTQLTCVCSYICWSANGQIPKQIEREGKSAIAEWIFLFLSVTLNDKNFLLNKYNSCPKISSLINGNVHNFLLCYCKQNCISNQQ